MTAPVESGFAVEPHMWIYAGTVDETVCDECPFPLSNKGAHPDHLQPPALVLAPEADALREAALPPVEGLNPLEVRAALDDAAEALTSALFTINRLRGTTSDS